MTSSQRGGVRRYPTTPDLIAEALREEIGRGMLKPGSALRQEELARRFGVSRLPVRDALLRLEAEGLVVIFPNRGAFVTRLSRAEVREIYDLRVLLEGDVLERAVPRMGAVELARIESALQVAELGASGPDWSALDRAFHLSLYAPAERPRHLAMVESLRGTVDRYRGAYEHLPERTPEWLDDHRQIVAACRRGDASAARRLLEGHIERAAAEVLAHLDQS